MSLTQSLSNNFNRRWDVGTGDVKSDELPACSLECCRISDGLSRLEDAEGHGRAVGAGFIRNRQVLDVVTGDLDEETFPGITFMELAG